MGRAAGISRILPLRAAIDLPELGIVAATSLVSRPGAMPSFAIIGWRDRAAAGARPGGRARRPAVRGCRPGQRRRRGGRAGSAARRRDGGAGADGDAGGGAARRSRSLSRESRAASIHSMPMTRRPARRKRRTPPPLPLTPGTMSSSAKPAATGRPAPLSTRPSANSYRAGSASNTSPDSALPRPEARYNASAATSGSPARLGLGGPAPSAAQSH